MFNRKKRLKALRDKEFKQLVEDLSIWGTHQCVKEKRDYPSFMLGVMNGMLALEALQERKKADLHMDLRAILSVNSRV